MSKSAAGDGRGGKKVVPPLRGRFDADDEVGNEDLPGFSRVWGWETKFADCFGANLRRCFARRWGWDGGGGIDKEAAAPAGFATAEAARAT